MALDIKMAGILYNSVTSSRISFHTSIKLFRYVNIYRARHKCVSEKLVAKKMIEHMLKVTDPDCVGAWTSVAFPSELLNPFGIYPIPLEVVAGVFSRLGLAPTFLDIADSDDVPNTMCSFHRILLGLSKARFLGRPRLVGATSFLCDGNVKSFPEVARDHGVPFLFIDVPYGYSEEGVWYVRKQLESALKTVSDLTGRKIGQGDLSAIARRSNEAFSLARRFYQLRRKSFKNLYRGCEVANFVFPLHFLLGSGLLPDILRKRCSDVESGTRHHRFYKSLNYSKSAMRLMWLHIVPQYNTHMWNIIDNGENARIVCDEYSAPYFEDYDPADLLGSIAKRLINHPSNGPIERRIEHVLKVAADFNVEGMIHYSNWGCHQAAGNVQLLGKAIQDAGYKFLSLNGDAIDQKNTSLEQHRTRLEAFLGN